MTDRLQQWFHRAASVFRRGELDRELDAEMAEHLELAIEENLERGMTADEARRQALIRFGGAEQAREQHREARGLPALDILTQDVRYAARGILKNPGFTTAAVLTLALGIAVNATMFSMVSAFLLRRPPGREPERVVVVTTTNPEAKDFLSDTQPVSMPNFLAWRAAGDIFSGLAGIDDFRSVNLTWQGQTEAISAAAVSANYFSVLDVAPQLGRAFAEGDDRPESNHVVVLSHELWDRKFGSDASLIGRTVRINREDYTVIGVMPASFRLMGFTERLWIPLVARPADQTAAARKDRSLFLFGRLRPGVTLEQAQAEMKTLARRAEEEFPETEKGWGVAARTLPDFLVHAFNIRNALVVAMTTVAFVLLIACGNVAGLLLARAGARRKELAIRMSLGAGRLRIVRQLLTEGLMIAILGGGLGLTLSYWGIKVVQANIAFNDALRAITLSLDWKVLVYTLCISLGSAVLCSLAPALTASRTDINAHLKDESRAASTGRSQGRMRTALVTAEIAVALFLLIGTGLLLHGFYLIEHQNLGFQAEHLLTAGVTLDSARYQDAAQQARFIENLLPSLRQIPGADAVAAVSDLPATGAGQVTLVIRGQAEAAAADQRPRAFDIVATSDYFRAAGIPMLRGRTFTETDNATAPRVVVVNQEFVHRHFKDQDPLGKQIRLDVVGAAPGWSEIVGVVGTVKTYSETSRQDPQVYEPFLQRPLASFSLVVRAHSDPNTLATALRKGVTQADVELPLARVMSMPAVIDEQKAGTPFFLDMLGTFALLALALAAIGIYGLVSYSVGQRTHELAIRMALGATGRNVLGVVLWQGLKMAGIGAAVGSLMAAPLPKVLEAMLEGLQIGEARLHLIVPVVIVAVAILATYIPARRASRIDPMAALHSN